MNALQPFLPNQRTRLTRYPQYDQRSADIDHCPYCHNDKITRTPRRKAGPALFSCRNCGFLANVDDILDAHELLGHRAA